MPGDNYVFECVDCHGVWESPEHWWSEMELLLQAYEDAGALPEQKFRDVVTRSQLIADNWGPDVPIFGPERCAGCYIELETRIVAGTIHPMPADYGPREWIGEGDDAG